MAKEDSPHDRESSLAKATRLIELERAQIGHEIHDGLLPLIFAASASVSNLLETTDGGDSREKLEQLSLWLDQAMQSGRRLLTQVYPPELLGSHWSTAAEDAAQRLLGETASKIRWELEAQVDEVPRPVALAAYRIVVESIRNAVTHGKASEIKVAGRIEEAPAEETSQAVCVTVTDDGAGFNPDNRPTDRFGIRSMIGRAELVGGNLTIDSEPGQGTTVTFRCRTN